MNGLDREPFSLTGFRGGEVWRNEGGEGPDGWFYWVGSAATQGPFPDKETAIADARERHGEH